MIEVTEKLKKEYKKEVENIFKSAKKIKQMYLLVAHEIDTLILPCNEVYIVLEFKK